MQNNRGYGNQNNMYRNMQMPINRPAPAPAPYTLPAGDLRMNQMPAPQPVPQPVDPRVTWAVPIIQKGWRNSKRRRRFMEMIRRGLRRKRYLEERRKLTSRIRENESTLKKMSEMLEKPGGAKNVIQLADDMENKAASRIQKVWKGYRARSKLGFVRTDYKLAKACKTSQKIYRNAKYRNTIKDTQAEARKENTFFQPTSANMWQRHEDKAVSSRKARLADPEKTRNQAPSELKPVVTDSYIDFLKDCRERRLHAAHCYNFREEIKLYQKEMERSGAIDGKLNQRIRLGMASKRFANAAQEKHEWRMKITQDMERYGVQSSESQALPEGSEELPEFVFETREEAAEAEDLLRDVEKMLQFDFQPYKPLNADEVAYPDCAKHEARERNPSKGKNRTIIDIDQPRMMELDDAGIGSLALQDTIALPQNA